MQANETFLWPYVDPPVFETFWFERFDLVKCRAWMERNWTLSLYFCVLYLTFIKVGTHLMKNRQPFDLRRPLALWNLGFAIFSIMGFIRCTPELLYVLKGENGFHRSVCIRDSHNEVAAFWAWVWTLSKVAELGDTVFIILRKKPLMFIHYYHHGIALIMCWCFYPDYEPIFRYFGISNYFVHSVLYSYLFLKAIDFKVPSLLSKAIISIELLQMIVGVIVNAYAIWIKAKGEPCEHRTEGIVFQMLVYLSFVVLFIYLFNNYKKDRASSKSKTEKKAK